MVMVSQDMIMRRRVRGRLRSKIRGDNITAMSPHNKCGQNESKTHDSTRMEMQSILLQARNKAIKKETLETTHMAIRRPMCIMLNMQINYREKTRKSLSTLSHHLLTSEMQDLCHPVRPYLLNSINVAMVLRLHKTGARPVHLPEINQEYASLRDLRSADLLLSLSRPPHSLKITPSRSSLSLRRRKPRGHGQERLRQHVLV